MKSLDQFDPLPKLGAKLQTEVVYYHSEEKEVAPYLYEKDGKLRYAPPLPESAWPFPTDVWMNAGLIVSGDSVTYFDAPVSHSWIVEEVKSGATEWPAVEEKQDNKPLEVGDRVRVNEEGKGFPYCEYPGTVKMIVKQDCGYDAISVRHDSGHTAGWPSDWLVRA
jgi:hypothetical protein